MMTNTPSTIESLLANESFQRWLSRTATIEENKQWEDWLQSDLFHQEIYQEAVKLWQLPSFQAAALPDVNQEWKKFQRQINLKPEKRASIIDITSKEASADYVSKSWIRYGAVAAAIVLIFLIWRSLPLIKHPDWLPFQTVSTDYGQRVRIALPEVAKIILNTNSTLRYPTNWTEKTICHFKLQGEAYFMVSSSYPKNPQHRFIVSTNDGKVQVVGTRFVVYERGHGTRVAVEHGCVQVFVAVDSSRLNSDSSVASISLKPGDLLQFRRGDRSLHPQSVNVLVYSSWCSDQLVLDNSRFEDIIRRLEETYSVDIKVTDKHLLERCLSGSIENSGLQIITEALGKALQVAVYREGKVMIFGNSF